MEIQRALKLQELLIERATNGSGDDAIYAELRSELLRDVSLKGFVPECVRASRTLSAFWSWIAPQSGQWEPRRVIIRQTFNSLLDHLEGHGTEPADGVISAALERFDPESVRATWAKALERRTSDPEGAITMARTLLEAVCRRILEERNIPATERDDLPKLYSLTADALLLAPTQHTEPLFKTILGSCQNVVNSLGSLRNKLGDAHGRGSPVRVAPRHAALAVSMAGTMAVFLAETSEARRKDEEEREVEKKKRARDPHVLAAIREKLPMSSIVGRRVQLKRAGREWRGLSPFVSETSPSFYVNDQKGWYHCFASSKHGDIFTFLCETEDMSMEDAVDQLGREAGV